MDFCCKNSPREQTNSVVNASSAGSLQTRGVYHCLWICWSGSWPELLCGVLCMLCGAAESSWCCFSLCCRENLPDYLCSEHCPFSRGQSVAYRVNSVTKSGLLYVITIFFNLPKFYFLLFSFFFLSLQEAFAFTSLIPWSWDLPLLNWALPDSLARRETFNNCYRAHKSERPWQ